MLFTEKRGFQTQVRTVYGHSVSFVASGNFMCNRNCVFSFVNIVAHNLTRDIVLQNSIAFGLFDLIMILRLQTSLDSLVSLKNNCRKYNMDSLVYLCQIVHFCLADDMRFVTFAPCLFSILHHFYSIGRPVLYLLDECLSGYFE